jgi:hypothetical protein
MPTNLKIDDALLNEAVELSGLSTKREVVNLALKEFVGRHKQMAVLELFGTIDYDPDYDYKKQRQRP